MVHSSCTSTLANGVIQLLAQCQITVTIAAHSPKFCTHSKACFINEICDQSTAPLKHKEYALFI